MCSSSVTLVPSPEQADQPILVGLDGGWVCSREQRGGMEGKVAVVCSKVEELPMPTYSSTFSWSERGPRRPPRQRHRLTRRRYVATFGPSKQLGPQAKAAAQTLDVDPSRPVVVIADGAQWIKKKQGRHFPQATCILDWAHLWREVSHAITAAARAKALSEQAREYQLHLHRSWLWHGGVEQALQGLRTLSTGLPAESLKPLQEAIRYLENQRPWIGSYDGGHRHQSPHEKAGDALVPIQCHCRGCPADRPAQRRLDSTSAVAILPLKQPWVLGRTQVARNQFRFLGR